jgi:hypothetical protein
MLNASGDSAAEAPPLRILKTRAPHAMNVRRFSGLFLLLPFLVKTIQPRPVNIADPIGIGLLSVSLWKMIGVDLDVESETSERSRYEFAPKVPIEEDRI